MKTTLLRLIHHLQLTENIIRKSFPEVGKKLDKTEKKVIAIDLHSITRLFPTTPVDHYVAINICILAHLRQFLEDLKNKMYGFGREAWGNWFKSGATSLLSGIDKHYLKLIFALQEHFKRYSESGHRNKLSYLFRISSLVRSNIVLGSDKSAKESLNKLQILLFDNGLTTLAKDTKIFKDLSHIRFNFVSTLINLAIQHNPDAWVKDSAALLILKDILTKLTEPTLKVIVTIINVAIDLLKKPILINGSHPIIITVQKIIMAWLNATQQPLACFNHQSFETIATAYEQRLDAYKVATKDLPDSAESMRSAQNQYAELYAALSIPNIINEDKIGAQITEQPRNTSSLHALYVNLACNVLYLEKKHKVFEKVTQIYDILCTSTLQLSKQYQHEFHTLSSSDWLNKYWKFIRRNLRAGSDNISQLILKKDGQALSTKDIDTLIDYFSKHWLKNTYRRQQAESTTPEIDNLKQRKEDLLSQSHKIANIADQLMKLPAKTPVSDETIKGITQCLSSAIHSLFDKVLEPDHPQFEQHKKLQTGEHLTNYTLLMLVGKTIDTNMRQHFVKKGAEIMCFYLSLLPALNTIIPEQQTTIEQTIDFILSLLNQESAWDNERVKALSNYIHQTTIAILDALLDYNNYTVTFLNEIDETKINLTLNILKTPQTKLFIQQGLQLLNNSTLTQDEYQKTIVTLDNLLKQRNLSVTARQGFIISIDGIYALLRFSSRQHIGSLKPWLLQMGKLWLYLRYLYLPTYARILEATHKQVEDQALSKNDALSITDKAHNRLFKLIAASKKSSLLKRSSTAHNFSDKNYDASFINEFITRHRDRLYIIWAHFLIRVQKNVLLDLHGCFLGVEPSKIADYQRAGKTLTLHTDYQQLSKAIISLHKLNDWLDSLEINYKSLYNLQTQQPLFHFSKENRYVVRLLIGHPQPLDFTLGISVQLMAQLKNLASYDILKQLETVITIICEKDTRIKSITLDNCTTDFETNFNARCAFTNAITTLSERLSIIYEQLSKLLDQNDGSLITYSNATLAHFNDARQQRTKYTIKFIVNLQLPSIPKALSPIGDPTPRCQIDNLLPNRNFLHKLLKKFKRQYSIVQNGTTNLITWQPQEEQASHNNDQPIKYTPPTREAIATTSFWEKHRKSLLFALTTLIFIVTALVLGYLGIVTWLAAGIISGGCLLIGMSIAYASRTQQPITSEHYKCHTTSKEIFTSQEHKTIPQTTDTKQHLEVSLELV